jgi:hypothetical protein
MKSKFKNMNDSAPLAVTFLFSFLFFSVFFKKKKLKDASGSSVFPMASNYFRMRRT